LRAGIAPVIFRSISGGAGEGTALAGPVFQEWYWGPILLAIFYGPPLVLSAVLVDAIENWRARRRGRRRSALLRAGVAGAVMVLLAGLAWALFLIGE